MSPVLDDTLCTYALRPLPAFEEIAPSAPLTEKADAVETDHAPPRAAEPQPVPSVRANRSSASLFGGIGSAAVTDFVVLLMAPWSSWTVSVKIGRAHV